MDIDLFGQLLYDEEGSTLDFKSEQYRFVKASKEDKGALLKDILTMSNGWRTGDAHILIGVKKVPGLKGEVVGVDLHLEDASIQQFVRSNVVDPLHFLYETLNYEGKKVGIIRIPVQPGRPFYSRNSLGPVKENVVYIRRGSSNGEATPAEIGRMAIEQAKHDNAPKASIRFAVYDLETGKYIFVDEIEINPVVLEIPNRDNLFRGHPLKRPIHVYLRHAEKLQRNSLVRPVQVTVGNTGGQLIENPKLNLEIDPACTLTLHRTPPNEEEDRERIERERYGSSKDTLYPAAGSKPPLLLQQWDKIQPKVGVISKPFYLGAKQDMEMSIRATLFADNLSDPIEAELTLKIVIKEEALSWHRLRLMLEGRYYLP